MDKKTNKALMKCAEQVLSSDGANNASCPLFREPANKIIHDSYNGQVSALGVSILMIGLCPTLAVYMQDMPTGEINRNEAYRIYVLEVIAGMLELYNSERYQNILSATQPNVGLYDTIRCRKAYNLTRYILNLPRTANGLREEKQLQTDILNCSVALKEVVRTYTLG